MSDENDNIKFGHIGIGSVLKRDWLVVPANQREYRWEKKQILDLVQDLSKAIQNKPSYFLGTIVLTPGQGEAFDVADGQQRLATTSILLAAIRDHFYTISKTRLVQSLDGFLFDIDREADDIKPRLTLNIDDNEFFRRTILAGLDQPAIKAMSPTKDSHRRISQAAELVAQHVKDVLRPHSEKNHISELNKWVRFIEKFAKVILLKVTDGSSAFVMFETLNDRGLKTTQADLLKNYLFSQVGDRSSEAHQQWSSMNATIEAIDTEDLTITYLRHLAISLYGHTRERDVYDTISKQVAGQGPAIAFLATVAENANDYAAIQTPTHAKWNTYHPNIRQYVTTLYLLGMIPLRPLMLSIVRRFSASEAEKAFRIFISWAVRLLIAGGGRSGALEEGLAVMARDVNDGKISTAKQVASASVKLIPTDAEFEAAFATARVSQNFRARYYLRALELKHQGSSEPEWIPNESVVINLEHILPENPRNGGRLLQADRKHGAATSHEEHNGRQQRLFGQKAISERVKVSLDIRSGDRK
jgi:hypothetical protein